jgi:type III secretion protein Q
MLQVLNKPTAWLRESVAPPAAGWQPPRLAHLAAREARLARLCHGAFAARLARLLPAQAPTLRVAPPATPFRGVAPAMLRLAHPAGVAAIVFDLAGFPALSLLERVPGSDPAAMAASAPLRRAALRVLVAPLVEQLAAIGLETVDPLELVRADGTSPPPQALVIELAWGTAGRRREARVWLPEAVAESLLALLEAPAAAIRQAGLPALRLPGRLMLGARRFALAELRRLEPGDVILDVANMVPLMPRARGAAPELAPFSCHAAWGSAGLMRAIARVRIDGTRLTLKEFPMITEETILQDAQALPGHPLGAEGASAELESLDIPVGFEIDTVALPLGELTALAPGYVLELPQRAENVPLRLVAYGRTIGTGELVTVGDRLGVRLLTIAHHDARASGGSLDADSTLDPDVAGSDGAGATAGAGDAAIQ